MQARAKEFIWICTPKDEIDQIPKSQGDVKSHIASLKYEAVESVSSYRKALSTKAKWINCFQDPM